MRLATVITPDGLRLHVRGSSATSTSRRRPATRARRSSRVLAGGAEALELVRRAAGGSRGARSTRRVRPGGAGRRTGSSASASTTSSTRSRAAGRRRSGPRSSSAAATRCWRPVRRPGQARPQLALRLRGRARLVIGRGGRYIPAEEALAAIAGYVVVNDATAREWQRAASQWTPGKNFDAVDADRPRARDHRRGRRLRRRS